MAAAVQDFNVALSFFDALKLAKFQFGRHFSANWWEFNAFFNTFRGSESSESSEDIQCEILV